MPTKRQAARALEQRSLPSFLPVLGAQLRSLENDPLPAYGLTADCALAYVNPAWDIEAARSGTLSPWPLGQPIRAALGCLERAFFEAIRRGVERGHASLVYECPTPTERRRYLAAIRHLGTDNGSIIRTQLLLAEPALLSTSLPVAAYCNADGWIRQCANCRRTCRPGTVDVWDWVPELLAPNVDQVTRGQITHGLCQSCLRELYPEVE